MEIPKKIPDGMVLVWRTNADAREWERGMKNKPEYANAVTGCPKPTEAATRKQLQDWNIIGIYVPVPRDEVPMNAYLPLFGSDECMKKGE